MDTERADENLRVIRSLLERTTIYRRSLAPVLLMAGVCGLIAGLAGFFLALGPGLGFGLYWYSLAAVLVVVALQMVHRQARHNGEAMWSPPARRLVRGLVPAFVCGLCVGVYEMLCGSAEQSCWNMAVLWLLFYGCGLQASSLFMPRELRWYGWSFASLGLLLLALRVDPPPYGYAHLLVGGSFGGLNLVFGARLAWAERSRLRQEQAGG